MFKYYENLTIEELKNLYQNNQDLQHIVFNDYCDYVIEIVDDDLCFNFGDSINYALSVYGRSDFLEVRKFCEFIENCINFSKNVVGCFDDDFIKMLCYHFDLLNTGEQTEDDELILNKLVDMALDKLFSFVREQINEVYNKKSQELYFIDNWDIFFRGCDCVKVDTDKNTIKTHKKISEVLQ